MNDLFSLKNSKDAILLLLLNAIALAGCTSTKIHYMTHERYKSSGSVEFLQQEPERPFHIIATIEGSSPKFKDGHFVFEKLRKKAQMIGGHAIIPFEYKDTPNLPERTPTYVPVPVKDDKPILNSLRYLDREKEWGKVLVIRYVDEN